MGLYAYRARLLRRYRTFDVTQLEQIEKLEQLRVLYYRAKILVLVTESALSLGVDTEEDLKKLRKLMPETLE